MKPNEIVWITTIALLSMLVGWLWVEREREQLREAEQRKALHGDFNKRFQPTLPPVKADPPPR